MQTLFIVFGMVLAFFKFLGIIQINWGTVILIGVLPTVLLFVAFLLWLPIYFLTRRAVRLGRYTHHRFN
jgi:hypothetical protein